MLVKKYEKDCEENFETLKRLSGFLLSIICSFQKPIQY